MIHGASLLEGSDRSSDGYHTVSWQAHIGITVNRDTGISTCISDIQFSSDSLAKPLKMTFPLTKLDVHLIDFDNNESYESFESTL